MRKLSWEEVIKSNMLNKSIAYRLSIYISLAVIGVFIAFIAIYFVFNQDLIKNNVQNKAISESADVISLVNQHVVATKEVTDNIAVQIQFYLEHGHTEDFIGVLLKKYPFINAIHINLDVKSPHIKYHNWFCFPQADSIRFFKGNERFETCLSKENVFIELLEKKKIGKVKDCPECGEAYPEEHGDRCRVCNGELLYLSQKSD